MWWKLIATILIAIVPLYLNSCATPKQFVPLQWKQGNAKDKGFMINDLLSKGILIWKTKDEIISLLGSPDITEYPGGLSTLYLNLISGHKDRIGIGYKYDIEESPKGLADNLFSSKEYYLWVELDTNNKAINCKRLIISDEGFFGPTYVTEY